MPILPLLLAFAAHGAISVQGHRGARAILPENTLAGFKYALEAGVDVLELDLAVTKDSRVVVAHDPVVNTTLCHYRRKNVPISTLTLAELQKIDCGSKRHPRFPRQRPVPGEKIPTLDEVFGMVKKSKSPAAARVEFNIETKIFPAHPKLTASPAEFARLVYGVVKKHGMVERTIVQSFDYRTLVAIKKIDPRLRIAFLNDESLPDFVAVAKSLGAEIISPHQDWITKASVGALRKAGVATIPWTANTVEQWDRLIDLGVDGIITDDPARLIKHLGKRGLR